MCTPQQERNIPEERRLGSSTDNLPLEVETIEGPSLATALLAKLPTALASKGLRRIPAISKSETILFKMILFR